MTTTAGNAASRALLPKERASVIMAAAAAASSSSVTATGHRTASGSAGISDPVIDEHFRRSLGKDYMNVFAPAIIVRRDQTPAADPTDVGGGSGDDDDDDAGLSGTIFIALTAELAKRSANYEPFTIKVIYPSFCIMRQFFFNSLLHL